MLNLILGMCHVMEPSKGKMVGKAREPFLYKQALELKIMGQGLMVWMGNRDVNQPVGNLLLPMYSSTFSMPLLINRL